MGEIAEMMLDGTLCASCGEFLSDFPAGYPCHCNTCTSGGIVDQSLVYAKPAKRKCKCQTCGKRVKEVGLKDHMRDAHGTK